MTDIEKYEADLDLRMKLELFMLKRATWLFKAYAKASWGKRKI